MYAAIQDGQEIVPEVLQTKRWELKKAVYERRTVIHVNPDKLLTLQVAGRGRTRDVAIFSPGLRRTIMWEVHQQTHA